MKLAAYLRLKGQSCEEFGRRIGRSKSTVSRIASGKALPDWETMRRTRRETEDAVTPNDFDTPEQN